MNDNLDFESYASQITGEDNLDNIPVSSNGVYDYPYQNVLVPTNGNITMRNVNHPILGISMETGEQKLMRPEQNYNFENTQNVLEIPQYQSGGQVTDNNLEYQIDPVKFTNIKGDYTLGISRLPVLTQTYNDNGTSSIQNFENYVLDNYREYGDIEDLTLIDAETQKENVFNQKYGSDNEGNFVELTADNVFPDGSKFYNKLRIPNNINDQIDLQDTFGRMSIQGYPNTPYTDYTQSDFDEAKTFMKDFISSNPYKSMLSNYYDDPETEQRNRMDKARKVEAEFLSKKEMSKIFKEADGVAFPLSENIGTIPLSDDFYEKYKIEKTYKPDEVKKMQKAEYAGKEYSQFDSFKEQYSPSSRLNKLGIDTNKIYLLPKQTAEVGVHEISHYIKNTNTNQYPDIIKRVNVNSDPNLLLNLPDGNFRPVDYLSNPTEIISRLDALRFLMKKNNIKDQTKDATITEKDLDKALKNENIKKDYNVKQLIDTTKNSQDLLWLLNNIVSNQDKNKTNNIA